MNFDEEKYDRTNLEEVIAEYKRQAGLNITIVVNEARIVTKKAKADEELAVQKGLKEIEQLIESRN